MSEHKFDNDLLSVVAHDLKTPVSAAKGFIELVQQLGPLNERQRLYSDKAMAALERMERLIYDLLEYSRIESGMTLKAGECDLEAILTDAISMMEELAVPRGIHITLIPVKKPVRVRADERLIGQVVFNLLSNAVKYNRNDGTITIRMQTAKDMIRVDIQDTGVGIAPDEIDRVFDRFYRTRQSAESTIDGTGLGLAIARSIILGHGGKIWVESVVDEGSTFSFTLPAVAKPGSGKGKITVEPSSGESASEEIDVVNDQLQSPPEYADSETHRDL